MKVDLDSETIEISVVYGKRKHMVIEMDSIGLIKVKAPKNESEELVRNFIETQKEWILEKLKERGALASQTSQLKKQSESYAGKLCIKYFGEEYPIHVQVDENVSKNHVLMENGEIRLICRNENQQTLKEALERFYRRECKKMVLQRIAHYQKEFKVKPRIVVVEDSKTKWGSCSSDRTLTFNWRLAMTSRNFVDYIVVHEMCHLVHMNHDRSFWRLVGKILPDYEKIIKENGLVFDA